MSANCLLPQMKATYNIYRKALSLCYLLQVYLFCQFLTCQLGWLPHDLKEFSLKSLNSVVPNKEYAYVVYIVFAIELVC